MRIHLAGVGGAFGGREDLSIQIHAAMLALHTSRPVKMVYNRQESFTGTCTGTPRASAPSTARRATAASSACGCSILLDGGAYASSSTAVTANAASFACRPVRGSERVDRGDERLHEQPALRRDARLRRRADLLRRRGADGQARAGARDRSRRAAPAERARAPAARCRPDSGITGSLPVAEVIRRCAALRRARAGGAAARGDPPARRRRETRRAAKA